MEDGHNVLPKGLCTAMCPKKEFNFRRKNNLIHKLEKNAEGKVEEKLCVKEFHRSAAGENISNPKSLRPGKTLLETIKYLFEEISFRTDVSSTLVYNFVFDRLRCVRQDAIIQQIILKNPFIAIDILEKCTKYYIYAKFKHITDLKFKIDEHINSNHLKDCLSSLLDLYLTESLWKHANMSFQNQEVMIACLLLNLNDHSVLMKILNYSSGVKAEKFFSKAIKFCLLNLTKHFFGMLKIIKSIVLDDESSNFIKLIFSLNAANCRKCLLHTLCHSHHSKSSFFPLEVLTEWLFLENLQNTENFCTNFGLEVVRNKQVKLSKTDFVSAKSSHTNYCPCFKHLLKVPPDKFL